MAEAGMKACDRNAALEAMGRHLKISVLESTSIPTLPIPDLRDS
jgi:hypothetical protein